MKRILFFLVSLAAVPAGAEPRGGLAVQAEGGSLSRLESWWDPGPGWEGRWWWEPAAGGSAWVRAGGFQAGPLTVSAGDEGLKTWGRGTGLSSGHWGLAFGGDGGGLWAVQAPDDLEAGIQGRWPAGRFVLAAGADRTWSLGLDPPAQGPWTDRVRAGVRWTDETLAGGFETSASLPAIGAPGWSARGRGSAQVGLWKGGVETSGAGTSGLETWMASAQAGWGPWSLGWSEDETGPAGKAEACWKVAGDSVSLSWGPADGFNTLLKASAQAGKVRWGGRFGASFGEGGWTGRAGLDTRGPWDRGWWSASWEIAPGSPDPEQTLTGGWKEDSFEAEARWTAQGLRLGWLGPGSDFRLTLKFLF